MGVSFYIPARFRILLSPLHNYLPFLIADYNPNHKLLTRLRTLKIFLTKTYDVTQKVLWVLAPLKSPFINTLNVLVTLSVFISGLFKVIHHP